jgi:hypothetical protein
LGFTVPATQPFGFSIPEFFLRGRALLSLNAGNARTKGSIEILIPLTPLADLLLQFLESQALAFSVCTLCGSILCFSLLLMTRQ